MKLADDTIGQWLPARGSRPELQYLVIHNFMGKDEWGRFWNTFVYNKKTEPGCIAMDTGQFFE